MQNVSKAAQDVIASAESHFGLQIITYSKYDTSWFLWENMTAHDFREAEYKKITEERFCAIRDWFQQRGWILSRRNWQKPQKVHFYLAPLKVNSLPEVFHATRVVNVESIMSQGLLPATKDTCNFKRLDSIGNIYAAPSLGSAGDHANENFGTAHWWAEKLAAKNRHNDTEWCILRLDLVGITNLICFNDLFSRTGVVLRPVDAIEPSRIKALG